MIGSASTSTSMNKPSPPSGSERVPAEKIIAQSVADQLPPGSDPMEFVRKVGSILKNNPKVEMIRVENTLFMVWHQPDEKGAEIHVVSIDKDPRKLAQCMVVGIHKLQEKGLHYIIGNQVDPGMIKIMQMARLPVKQIKPGTIRVDF